MSVSELYEGRPSTMAKILMNVPALDAETACHDAAELFRRLQGVQGFALISNNEPIGVIGRDDLTIKLATQFGHAVYGKRPASDLMISNPLIVDIADNIDVVERMITDGYESALSAGFIITDNHKYVGMGNVLSLMRESVKRTRIQNRQLAQSTQLAKQANTIKSQFLAGMSHELRTPLNAIIGFSELISQEAFGPVTPPRYRQYAEDILDSGKHLLAMINDVLDMSKIEAGRYELNNQLIDVNSIARNVVKICSVLALKKNITLSLDIPEFPIAVLADERSLKQMLLNLISNGIKYTEANGNVTVSISKCQQKGLRICVTDTGVGIAENDIKKITEPFVQLSQSHNNKAGGTGLGLAIVKALANLHGCTFQLKSKVGEGTSASLTFPAERSQLTNTAA